MALIDLFRAAATIKNETVEGANSANRIGQMFESIISYFSENGGGSGGGSGVETLTIASLDDLNSMGLKDGLFVLKGAKTGSLAIVSVSGTEKKQVIVSGAEMLHRTISADTLDAAWMTSVPGEAKVPTITLRDISELDTMVLSENIYVVNGEVEGMLIKIGNSPIVHSYDMSQYNINEYN